MQCQLAKLILEIVPSQSGGSKTMEHLNIELGGKGGAQVQIQSLCLLAKFLPTTVLIFGSISCVDLFTLNANVHCMSTPCPAMSTLVHPTFTHVHRMSNPCPPMSTACLPHVHQLPSHVHHISTNASTACPPKSTNVHRMFAP